jgi:hypothetical protein
VLEAVVEVTEATLMMAVTGLVELLVLFLALMLVEMQLPLPPTEEQEVRVERVEITIPATEVQEELLPEEQ